VIVVSGAIANKMNNGGEAWVRLSWLLGMKRLGIPVYFVEEIDAATCVDASGRQTELSRSVNAEYFRAVMGDFGMSGNAALVLANGSEVVGTDWTALRQLCSGADLLLNISGNLSRRDLFDTIRRRAFVDIDPGFTQLWHAAGNPAARIDGHHFYFTIAENIGRERCTIPTCGIDWRTIRQPVVLDEWPAVRSTGRRVRFTTVGSWRGSYGVIKSNGISYGLKVHEFRKFLELPQRVDATFEIALAIHAGDAVDRDRLLEHGWQLTNPLEVSASPHAFRQYVQESHAEFSVAQGIYVQTQSGWFSDRTVRYLASGKPALVQDTGFPRDLSVDGGLVRFTSIGEAITGAHTIINDHEKHAERARGVAEKYFDSDKILPELLEQVGFRQ